MLQEAKERGGLTMGNNTEIDKVREAAKVIIDFCRTHGTCEHCEAWEQDQDYEYCQFRAYPDEWGSFLGESADDDHKRTD